MNTGQNSDFGPFCNLGINTKNNCSKFTILEWQQMY